MDKTSENFLKNIPPRNYAHFDERKSMKQAWNYVTDDKNIIKHNFYPFIYYEKDYSKYNAKVGIKEKKRKLCYSSHIDRCIYQYYSYLLNEKYNERSDDDGISDVAVAYKNNLGKNNIDFAKKVIDFIRSQEQCYIIVGDFTGFFDSLNHEYLKARICNLLKLDKMPNDFYSVFKNITKYSEWSLHDLLELNDLKNTTQDRKKLNSQERVLTIKQFHSNKRRCLIVNRENKGIPQGSAISAIFSNIYMLDFDKATNEFVKSNKGLYMRYSDDFIIILPKEDGKSVSVQYNFIMSKIKEIPNLELEINKTQFFEYNKGNLNNRNVDFIENSKAGKNVLNYLGFSFDGKTVTVRAKTISKYYYRMYRKINTIVKHHGVTPNKQRVSCRQLYQKYSRKGAHIVSTCNGNDRHSGNFLTYIGRAKRIFGNNENIDGSTRRHMQKIRKRLNLME